MSHVFISYKREDEVRVGRLARALEPALNSKGIELWWDRSLLPAGNWHTEIGERLDAAAAVIVVWSQLSVAEQGNYVRDEARVGQSKGVLVPVLFDQVRIPNGFGEIQAIDLVGWRGSSSDPAFKDLVDTLVAKVEGGPTPPPRAPKAILARRLALGALSATGIGALTSVLLNLFGSASIICHAPTLQPALGDFCGACRLGGTATRADRLAWEALHPGVCEDLQVYINRFPTGVHAAEASRRFQAAVEVPITRWRTETRMQPVRLEGPAAHLREDQQRANALCLGLAASLLSDGHQHARVKSVDFPACSSQHCDLPVVAACTLETPYPEISRTCPASSMPAT